jgi:hypothetical protein
MNTPSQLLVSVRKAAIIATNRPCDTRRDPAPRRDAPLSNLSLTQLFEESCDPHAYIPRRATEEVLKCLSSLIRDSEPVVVLHGPGGIGKSMLLSVLRERFGGERRVAYASIGEVPEPEFCHRILDELSEPTAEDPAGALIRVATDGQNKLLLLVDHPDLAPVASSLQLASVAKSAAPHITVVFAISDEADAQQFSRALCVEASVTTLGFTQAMDQKESSAYVRLRLARTELPASLRDQLDERAIKWLTDGAQAGLPREINRRASELLRIFEQSGEEALQLPVQGSDSIANTDRESEVTAPRPVDPASRGDRMLLDSQTPAFPMRPGEASDHLGAPIGGGSLGGMLLGSGPGAKPNFEMDLELGRSLSSGLLDGPSTRPSARDGGPVSAEEMANAAAAAATSADPETSHRHMQWIAASLAAFAIGGAYFATRSEAPAAHPTLTEDVVPFEAAKADLTGAPSLMDTPNGRARIAAETEPTMEPAASSQRPIQERPSLASGPMGSAAQDAIDATDRKTIEVAEVVPPSAPIPRVAPRPSARRPLPLAPKTIVLPARTIVGNTTTPGSFVRLSIDVEPGSQITVDGESIGIAPFSEIFVEMGTHTFVAETPNGIVVKQLVDVQTGTDIIEF